MILEVLAAMAFVLASVPALLYVWNAFLFRRAPRETASVKVSVLIPARNEEQSIAACVEAVLASRDVQLEAIVLDDHSEDRTVEIVRAIARKDSRVRVEAAPSLPHGWCGKQHACFALSKLARFPILTFLDADVRLAPDALARMAAFQKESKAGLVSGFPRQETGTFLEKLIVPLINWLLLSYLPIIGMRTTLRASFGAGCGQWFLTTREAYDRAGGHEAVKSSLHDGLTLPRAYREAGIPTDICDATDLAVCRMYRSGMATWNGFAKNAHEGMGSAKAILPWTAMLLGGQVLPFALLVVAPDEPLVLAAAAFASLPRLACAIRYRQSMLGAILHPVGIVALLSIQWYALARRFAGRPIGWKGRRPALPIASQASRG